MSVNSPVLECCVKLKLPSNFTPYEKARCRLWAKRLPSSDTEHTCEFCQRQCTGSELPCGHFFCDECDERLRGFERSNELAERQIEHVPCPRCQMPAAVVPLRNRRYFYFNLETYIYCTLWLLNKAQPQALKILIFDLRCDIIWCKSVFGVIRNPFFSLALRRKAAQLLHEHLITANIGLFNQEKITANQLPVTLFGWDPTLCAGCGIFLKPGLNEPQPGPMKAYSRGYCGDVCCCMSLDDRDIVIGLLKE